MKELIDSKEYEQLFPYQAEFDAWVTASEHTPSIRVQVERDRFLFEQDDENDEFSPYNTCNS